MGKETKSAIHNRLKPEGFRRAGAVWNRRRGDLIDVIELQYGPPEAAGVAPYTIAAGVTITDVCTIIWGPSAKPITPESRCCVRARIGELMPRSGEDSHVIDTWWSDAGDLAVENAVELSRLTVELVVPFLSSHSTIRDVREGMTRDVSWRRKHPLWTIEYAVLGHLLGEQRECQRLLEEIRKNSTWGDKVEEIEERLRGTR